MKKLSTLFAAIAVMCFATAAKAQPIVFDDLGVIGGEGTYAFDNIGSIMTSAGNANVDAVIGVWDSSGVLLASDDDSGGSLFSLVNVNLTEGDYWIGASEFTLGYVDNWVNNGSGFEAGEVATMQLNIDGGGGFTIANVDETAFAESAWWRVTVQNAIPEPGTLGLISVAGLGLFIRRRRK